MDPEASKPEDQKTTQPNHKGEHIIDLVQKIEQCRGWRLQQQLKQIDLAHKILFQNAADLLTLLDRHDDLNYVVNLMAMGNKPALQAEWDEANRLLHNFLASAKSIVEMDRNIIRASLGQELINTYEAESKLRFAEDPLCQFVQQLRNYCLHVANPIVGSQVSGKGNDFETAFLHLVKQSVMSWTGWNAPARSFLKDCAAHIRLQPIIKSYCEKTDEFRKWIYDLFQNGNKADFEHLAKLQAVGQAAMLEDMKSAGFSPGPSQ